MKTNVNRLVTIANAAAKRSLACRPSSGSARENVRETYCAGLRTGNRAPAVAPVREIRARAGGAA